MTAAEYLASEPVGNADLLEMLRRGTADVLYCTQHALAMHERVSGAAVLCAETEREARAALEHLPHTGLYVAHGALCARLLREETGCTGGQKCRQARYLRPVPPAPVPGVELRILDESHTDLVFEHYHMAPGRDYVAERLAAGAMTGAFLDGVLAGFIGIHEEGSIGMLEVLPAYRRRGLGYALEAGAIRRALKEGAIPYCQVIERNTASMELQKKLGLEFSDGFVYWLF